jgi:hypothetical protein
MNEKVHQNNNGILYVFAFIVLLVAGGLWAMQGQGILSSVTSQIEIAAPVSAQEAVVAVDQLELTQNLSDNWFLSTRHPESAGIMSSLYSQASYYKVLHRKGDPNQKQPRSNGSIRIYAGLDAGSLAHIAIINISSKSVVFAVLDTTYATKPGNGLIQIADAEYYYDPSKIFWKCAWIMADRIKNGHGVQGIPLTVGQGWSQWGEIQLRYNLVIEMGEVTLP